MRRSGFVTAAARERRSAARSRAPDRRDPAARACRDRDVPADPGCRPARTLGIRRIRRMRLLAIATVFVSATTTIVGLLLIAGTPADMVPVGYRIPEMPPFVALQLAFTAVGALLVLRRPE